MNAMAGRGGALVTVYKWLAANGVEEWLPNEPTIEVTDTELTYDAFVWQTQVQRGFNASMLCGRDGYPMVKPRTVPLLEPPSLGVLAACEVVRARLIDARTEARP